MTSVRSLLPQLNGNSAVFAVLLLFALSTTACDLFRPAQDPGRNRNEGEEELDVISGGRVFNPETGEYEEVGEVVVENMDTINWRFIPPSQYPPITSEEVGDEADSDQPVVIGRGEQDTEFLESYNVSLMLPFLTNRFNPNSPTLYDNSSWAIHFYAGAKLAFNKLEAEGVQLNVNVFDTEASEQTVQSLIDQNSSLEKSHLILGGVQKSNVMIFAEFAKRKGVPYASPYNASAEISSSNPFYIQINPTLVTHLESITSHALESYDPDQIVLVVQNEPEEIARLEYIQQAHQRIAGTSDVPEFEEVIVDGGNNFQNLDLSPLIRKGKETVFIVPSWSNTNFIFSFLRKAFVANRFDPVVVYGMPQWQSYEEVDYNFYETLQLYISSANHIDTYAPDVKEFRQSFFNTYGTLPREEAYMGYDDMLYFGRMLQEYGTKFHLFLDREEQELLNTRFQFEPVVDSPSGRLESFRQFDRYENKFVYILGFEEYHYEPKN